jgi:hypothetical protein
MREQGLSGIPLVQNRVFEFHGVVPYQMAPNSHRVPRAPAARAERICSIEKNCKMHRHSMPRRASGGAIYQCAAELLEATRIIWTKSSTEEEFAGKASRICLGFSFTDPGFRKQLAPYPPSIVGFLQRICLK